MKNVISKNVYFSTYFNVAKEIMDNYGAYDISLVMDTPLFIDPFLLFNSEKEEYQELHKSIVEYLIFLKEQSRKQFDGKELTQHLNAYYMFPEVKECWLGYSHNGNEGAGLNKDFAQTLYKGLNSIIKNVGNEKISKGAHLEKLCLIGNKVDIDKISDFTANLIKGFLLSFTEKFARDNLSEIQCKMVPVDRANFNYTTKTFVAKSYYLPIYKMNGKEEFVILTPKDILRNDKTWINKQDLYNDYQHILGILPDKMLKYQFETYIHDTLLEDEKHKATKTEIKDCLNNAVKIYPEFLDYYIKYKEDNGADAIALSAEEVSLANNFLNDNVRNLILTLMKMDFYKKYSLDSFEEAVDAVKWLKDSIEINGLWRNFYDANGQPIEREEILNNMYRLCFRKSHFLYNDHVDNGNGACDSQISFGSDDCTIVEFKLAKSSSLKNNLEHQTEEYMKANHTEKGVKAVLYFNDKQKERCLKVINELNLQGEIEKSIFLIDAKKENKVSASKIK